MSRNFKICSLGDTGAGKTSLIKVIKDEDYFNVKSTIGMDYHSLKLENQHIEIWDTAGDERYRSLSTFYLRNCDLILLVFDVSKMEILDLEYWNKFIDENNEIAKIFIIFNKIDLKSEYRLMEKEIRDIFRNRKIEIFETSVKNEYGIEKIITQIKKILPRQPKKFEIDEIKINIDITHQRPFCCKN
jgi:small GTP-binding protein